MLPPRALERLKRSVPLLLFALNLLIAWRLFTQEYTNRCDSIEPFFYALAAAIKVNPLHPVWWPSWNGGMPFRYTYQPLLHHIVAALSFFTGWTTARAFHAALALFYAAGPTTLYLFVLRFSQSFRTALTAALLYSLWSPSTWLILPITVDTGGAFHAVLQFGKQYPDGWHGLFDTGGLFNARRLRTAVTYGDGPCVAGLTLVPLALLLIHRATQKRSTPAIFIASLALIAVPLTNIPAALTLAMAILAYLLSAEPAERLPRLFTCFLCATLGFALVAPLIPPSSLLLTARNTQWMDPQGQLTAVKLLWIAIGLLTLTAISFTLRRLRLSPFARFSTLFLLITATVVLGKAWLNISVLAQPIRFHLALEMAIALCLAAATARIHIRNHRVRIAMAALLTVAIAGQITNYRLYARKIVKHEPIWNRSEYKIAQWMDRNAHGNRVWVPGSVSFWFNALTTTPQLTGCCDQNLLFKTPRIATYEMGTDDGAGTRAGQLSIAWMQAMGVKYVALSDPRSTEFYGVTHHPAKFTGLLPQIWHDDTDDAIYEIPGPPGSLAHWIAPSEAVTQMPVNGVEIAPMLPCVAAVSYPTRPQAHMSWQSTERAVIQGTPEQGNLLSVQIPYHFGWRAESNTGTPIPIHQDGLGFLLLNPNCQGPCTVTLVFSGGMESKALLALTVCSWLTATALLIHNRNRSNPKVSPFA